MSTLSPSPSLIPDLLTSRGSPEAQWDGQTWREGEGGEKQPRLQKLETPVLRVVKLRNHARTTDYVRIEKLQSPLVQCGRCPWRPKKLSQKCYRLTVLLHIGIPRCTLFTHVTPVPVCLIY